MQSFTRKRTVLPTTYRLLLTTCICFLILTANATVRRVDAGLSGGSQNGSSWSNAYSRLQDAINASASGDEVWIKAGTYIPLGPLFGNTSFNMKNGVKIYGGFNGTETALGQQNWITNRVFLKQFFNGSNYYPIILNNNVNGTALLDGVNINDGFFSPTDPYGVGMCNYGSSFPTISNVEFRNNYGIYGAALYIEGGNSAITNVFFASNHATLGGAAYFKNCTPVLTNVVFNDNYVNGTGNGGAVYSEESAPVYNNVVFYNNRAPGNGAGVYNVNSGSMDTRRPSFTNVLFLDCRSSGGYGGGMYNDRSKPYLINCTFAGNYCGIASGGGGVYTTSPSGTGSGDYPTATITNCIFSSNGYAVNGNLNAANDVDQQRGNSAVSYSSLNEAGSYASFPGNVPSITSPFTNTSNPLGNDGKFFTADDGYRLSVCRAANAIDKGNNGATGIATDMSGLPRKVAVDLIPDGGSGTSPIIDMGAYEDQTSATLLSLTGSIGNGHTVPYPQELSPDLITNVQSPGSGTSITWQQSDDSTTWVTIPGANSVTYAIPSINQTTYYRRGAASASLCNAPFYSNVIKIKVVQSNGAISGKVISNNGTGVQGITVNVARQAGISGSPAGYTYTTVTDASGDYSISPIYYGDPNLGNVSATFRITPVKANHGFNQPYLDKTLSANIPQLQNVTFTDTTVLSITGRIYQQCTTCNSAAGITETQNCPIDSITIYKDGVYNTVSGFIDTAYGRYAVTVSDPVQVKIEPRYTGHSFSPAFTNITPTTNIPNVDFKDITTHTISGKLTAGCGAYIGTAVLEFTDALPNDANGNPRNSCFRKRVTTNTNSGFYSITLPARKYKVQIISFTPSVPSGNVAYVDAATLINFINTKVSKDSLTRDVTKADTTLNIEYQRPPEIGITGLPIVCTTPTPFSLIKQAATDSFRVFVYQGAPSFGCPVSDTNQLKIITNVQNEDQTEEIRFALSDTGRQIKLKGGIPNITGDHLKDLFVYFTDKYGRIAASFNRKVLVTGIKPDAATFTTVSPQIPLLVLHDPPGDASYSTWQSNKSVTNTMRFYAAGGVGVDAWIEAKVGAKAQIGLVVSTEVSAWGTINASIGVASKVTSTDEAVITTTTSQNFSTAGNPDVIGGSGDVYIGAALNLIYANSTEIKFSGCSITTGHKLVVANTGLSTTYIYSEDHILNTIIPNLEMLAQQSNTADAARYRDQIRIWQQVVDNNAANKTVAGFAENYSFDGAAGPYTNSTTTSSSKTNTIEFMLEINAGIAATLGFEVAGSGVSGGVAVNFKFETGRSESNTVTDETTIAYTLDDDDAGDFFSVNVKKDPVYNTPMFELAAGTASCPAEPGAQPRDDMFFTAANPVMQNVPNTDYANFTLKIVNTSQSHQTRTYRLAYDQGTNIANESIRIAGTDYTGIPITLSPLAYLDSAIVVVSIKRLPGSSVFSYEGERFVVEDNCDGSVSKSLLVSAYYVTSCSNISLSQPQNGWLITSTTPNSLFIKPGSYVLANLTSVNLEYSVGNSSNWNQGPFLTTTQLANGFNWSTLGLPDGTYNLRLRLDCSSGVVYSQRVTGIIDRTPPALFGRPTPTDDNYVNGDVIAFTYNENLNTVPDSLQITVRRLSNGTLLPATASIADNKILITPNSPITGFTGDSIRVIVGRAGDEYGNRKVKPDTIRFTVGTTVVGTGNQALSLAITNQTVYKNGDSAINVFFKLPVNATKETRVNYAISGTARYGIDYTVTYTGADALYADFNGAQGVIKISNNSKQAILSIRPIGDTGFTADKTVIISLTEGGDYSIGAPGTITGTISSEDGISVYTFNGDGNWNIRSNWLNGKMPLTTLMAPKEIIVNPSGIARLNVKQTIKPGAKLTVKQFRQLVIQGSLKQQ